MRSLVSERYGRVEGGEGKLQTEALLGSGQREPSTRTVTMSMS